MAGWMQGLGLGMGSKVAVGGSNSAESVYSHFALPSLETLSLHAFKPKIITEADGTQLDGL